MPRVTRAQQHENLGVSTANNAAVNKKKLQLGLGLRQIGGGNENMSILAAAQQNGKRKNAGSSVDKMPSKRRAALGEITNAFAETTTQARKGLSKMMSKGSLKATKSSSQPSSTETTAKPKKAAPIKKPPRAGRPNTRRSKDSISTESKSLPCTQEEASTLVLPGARETFAPIDLSDDEDSVSVYESADDGDDEAEDDDHHDGRGDEEKISLPDGVTDFDGENVNDPNQVSEYAMEVFQYYKDREAQFRVPDYVKVVQNEVTPHMRAVLVDWLVEVQESFELNHETLYTAVKMLDLYLSQVRVHKEDLQLIGATACLIASKIDERLPPTLSDFVYVCDDAYNETDLKRKEIEMIRVVDFDVGYPLSYRFFRRYARVSGFAMPTMTFGRYMLELALMDYTLNVDTSESKLAAAAVVVTAKVHNLPEESWRPNLEHFSGYKIEECLPQIQKLHALVLKPSSVSSTRKTIRTKYSHAVFHSVAQKQIPVHISL